MSLVVAAFGRAWSFASNNLTACTCNLATWILSVLPLPRAIKRLITMVTKLGYAHATVVFMVMAIHAMHALQLTIPALKMNAIVSGPIGQ